MIQKTFILSRRDEMWLVISEWEQFIQDKPKQNMFMVFTENGLSEDKLNDVLSLVVRKYPDISMIGMHQRSSQKYNEYLRVSFCLMEHTIVTPFSCTFEYIDEQGAFDELSDMVEQIEDPACIILFAAGSAAKISHLSF